MKTCVGSQNLLVIRWNVSMTHFVHCGFQHVDLCHHAAWTNQQLGACRLPDIETMVHWLPFGLTRYRCGVYVAEVRQESESQNWRAVEHVLLATQVLIDCWSPRIWQQPCYPWFSWHVPRQGGLRYVVMTTLICRDRSPDETHGKSSGSSLREMIDLCRWTSRPTAFTAESCGQLVRSSRTVVRVMVTVTRKQTTADNHLFVRICDSSNLFLLV